jgi:hypothetical protein
MARAIGSLVGGKDYLADYFVSAAVTVSQILVREATASNAGEAADPTTTTATDCLGCATDQATYTATPTQNPGAFWPPTSGTLENLVRIEVNPFAIYRFPISGGATAGTALSNGASGAGRNILIISTAGSKTVLTAAGTTGNSGTNDLSGGLVIGKSGANVGQIRKLVSHVDNTSDTVTVGFLNNTVLNDMFIKVPFGRSVQRIQMTSDFTQANGVIATGTGAFFRVLNVVFDEQNSLAWVDAVSGDHMYNPESA